MKSHNSPGVIIAIFALLAILACNGTFTAQFPTPTTFVPTETATALPSPVPPTPEVFLSSVSLNEENQNPNYRLKAAIPNLQGSADVRVVNFNTAMTNLVNTEINEFKKTVSELPLSDVSPSSSLDVTYTPVLQRGNLWSLKFDFAGYFAGAAHPYLYSLTVNYDLDQGRELALSDLFLPNSNYLELIANYCIAELGKRDILGFDGSLPGAAPTPENYRNWNITADGLLITFDESQVAANAAGPQAVNVPYSELQAVTNPEGPLAAVTP